MKVGEILTKYDGENRLYLPPKHKTSRREKGKTVLLGCKEQKILKKYLENKELYFEQQEITSFF
jgi:hypothetical protein